MNVLSMKIDRAVVEKKFKFHPGCKSLSLTHLCFDDDLMVFVEGSKKSIEGALSVFEVFESWSGLRISLEKSTIFMAGVAEEEKCSILTNFPFEKGDLPVKYLGLPLMTKCMRREDYLPLMEKIRSTIVSWTCRFLSYAGRLQQINSVLLSIVNFWSGVFRLPSACVKEVEQLCAAFLWTGPSLKTTGAKLAWNEICCRKNEGGLGIRNLKEVNKVNGLKLIWRLLSGDSLWGNWIKMNLLKGKNFWEVNSKTQMGSWMWRKILKLRELGNGRHISFWFDIWSERGTLYDLLGPRGIIEMGVSRDATLEEAVYATRRRRRHRLEVINEIEDEMRTIANKLVLEKEDKILWRGKHGFKQIFSTQDTWFLIRVNRPPCSWARAIWFTQATPKYAFMAWLAVKNRMSTLDRIASWSPGVDGTCILCKNDAETRNHLFFECGYSAQVWEFMVKGILKSAYTNTWTEIIEIISDDKREKLSRFCLRYAFQAVLYAIWTERNRVIHGEKLKPLSTLKKVLDKGVRNRITLMSKERARGMEKLMQYWFYTRM